MKRPAKTYYRKAAQKCVHVYDARHPPWSRQTQHTSNTKTPNGMWVEMWVWVPTEAALMEKKE